MLRVINGQKSFCRRSEDIKLFLLQCGHYSLLIGPDVESESGTPSRNRLRTNLNSRGKLWEETTSRSSIFHQSVCLAVPKRVVCWRVEKCGGRVLDWGASGAILQKGRIVEFLKEMELPEEELQLAKDNLIGLTSGTEYALFAWEG